MPASILEGHKPGAAKTSDSLRASVTFFSKQFTITIDTIGIVRLVGLVCILDSFVAYVARGESLASQRFVAIATIKTVPMPWLIAESDPT